MTQRRRRRWPWLIAAVVVVGALLVGAEFAARSIVAGVVRTQVVDALDLPADQQIAVETEGILLPQLIVGRMQELRLSSPDVSVGPLRGEVTVEASGVPIRGGQWDAATGEIRIGEADFTELIGQADLPVDEITFDDSALTAAGRVDLLGVEIPLSLTLTPSADAGAVLLTPVRATVGGLELDAAALQDRFGSAVSALTGPQRICIADRISAGIVLTGLRIEEGQAVARFDIDGAIAEDPALQQNGVCTGE